MKLPATLAKDDNSELLEVISDELSLDVGGIEVVDSEVVNSEVVNSEVVTSEVVTSELVDSELVDSMIAEDSVNSLELDTDSVEVELSISV